MWEDLKMTIITAEKKLVESTEKITVRNRHHGEVKKYTNT